MTKSTKQQSVLATIDFALTFLVFWSCSGILPGQFPRWFFLVATSLVWAGSGFALHKFEFYRFKRPRIAIATIAIVDVVVYAACFILWKLIFPERNIIWAQIWPLPILVVLEWGMYRVYHRLFKHIPYLYVENLYDSIKGEPANEECIEKERGMEKTAHCVDSWRNYPDVYRIYTETGGMDLAGVKSWILAHKGEFAPTTLVLESGDPALLEGLTVVPDAILLLCPFNRIRHFNDFLEAADRCLPNGGVLVLHGETAAMRRKRIESQLPPIIGPVAFAFDYFWTRVLSKLFLTRDLYMALAGRKHRNFSRVEVLGRMARAGFAICGEDYIAGSFFVSAVRKGLPQSTTRPYYGLFIRLPRIGKNGKHIGVFKLRTMYAYSEYIQDYVYELNGLEKGGKLNKDFRVNFIGRFFRSHFLDEFPMFINMLKGDLKLVGVRPLSAHYLSLYTPQMRELHLSVKPGIFPPPYYEYPKPVSLDDVQESERRYIEANKEHPFCTDWKYFWGILRNIIFRRERSH